MYFGRMPVLPRVDIRPDSAAVTLVVRARMLIFPQCAWLSMVILY